jgi:phosphate transport system substrate-binding protein
MRFRAAAITLALLVGACGTDDNTTGATDAREGCATGSVAGAGSTFVQNIVQQWIKDYAAGCPGATVNYQGIGSGAGIQQFIAGTVDFGATDAVMKADEQAAAEAKGGPVLHIPWSAGGIAVEHNLDGVDLRLSPASLAGIFQGTITRWDDPSLTADNPGATLPPLGIQVVHRSDGSGTTDAFTSYLKAAAPEVWKAGSGKDVPWPTGQGAKGSDGVTGAVKQAKGAIGYAEVSFAEGSGLGIAKIKNAAGNFVAPTEATVSEALDGATTPDDLKIKVDYRTTAINAYPISTPTWVIVFQKQASRAKGELVKSFLRYALDDGQDTAGRLFYAPVPDSLARKARAAVESIAA